jgi:hypothetical protein
MPSEIEVLYLNWNCSYLLQGKQTWQRSHAW